MTINTAQIRAARGLLNWTQSELARRTNISTTSIGSIENGETNPRESTIHVIQQAFEDAGIEFLPGSGIRQRDEMIKTIEGDTALDHLNDDIYQTLAATGGEVLIFGLEERANEGTEDYEKIKAHLERIKQAKITERILIRDGDTNLIAPAEFYRGIDEKYFSPYPFFIYANKLALITWGPPMKILIIESKLFTQTFKNVFEFMWEQAKTVK